jgi:hypothetical protein
MSILVVHLVPQGMLFAADRNVTTTLTGGGFRSQGQSQRPKVLRWPNREMLIVHVDVPTDEVVQPLVCRLALNRSLADVSKSSESSPQAFSILEASKRSTDSGRHASGFVRNTSDLTVYGPTLGDRFAASEEIAQRTTTERRRATRFVQLFSRQVGVVCSASARATT